MMVEFLKTFDGEPRNLIHYMRKRLREAVPGAADGIDRRTSMVGVTTTKAGRDCIQFFRYQSFIEYPSHPDKSGDEWYTAARDGDGCIVAAMMQIVSGYA